MVKGKKNLPSLGEESKWMRMHYDYEHFSEDENDDTMEQHKPTETVQLQIVQSVKPQKAKKKGAANAGRSSGPSDVDSNKNKTIVVIDQDDFEKFSVKNKGDIESAYKDTKAIVHTAQHDDSHVDQVDSNVVQVNPYAEQVVPSMEQEDRRRDAIRAENYSFQVMTLSVSEESITRKALENTFADNYMEGVGTPRLFVIQLQSQQAGYAVFHVHERSNSQQMEGICRNNVVRISLTVKCSISKKQGHMIHEKLAERVSCDRSQCTVRRLVACIEECLKEFCAVTNPSHKVKKQKAKEKVKKSSSAGSFSYLTQLNGWTVKAFDEEEALQIVASESHKEEKCVASLPRVPSATGGNNMCDICFETIRHGGHMTGYAMQSCDHWFCNDCWFKHLESCVSKGDRQISCPGHCKTVVDTATLISLLPYSYFIRYESYVNKAKLEISKEWKWCQGASGFCTKIIRATARNTGPNETLNGSSEEGICVSCSCKTQWCFDCGKEPHWPATCELAASYISEAQRLAVEISSRGPTLEPTLDDIIIKQCPNCKVHIEKYEGCLHVTCPICRHKFCFQCLFPWDDFLQDTLHDANLCSRREKGKVSLYELSQPTFQGENISHQMEEAFKNAIKFRNGQQLLEKKPTKLAMFLQEWYFVLQWCNVVVFASYLKNVDNSTLRDPLDRMQFCAEAAMKKLANQNLRGLEALKTSGEKQLNQLCTRIKSLQKALLQAYAENKVTPMKNNNNRRQPANSIPLESNPNH